MKKMLVVYFSASGVTKAVARKVADAATADIFEIVPKVPYTKADLNWMNPLSRSSKEMRGKNKDSRPEIVAEDLNVADYDVIFLGFPIWWYVAPTIVNTFLESYDFAGKKIVLFATSGSSGFGNTIKYLTNSVSDSCEIIEGKMLTKATDSEIKAFVEEYYES